MTIVPMERTKQHPEIACRAPIMIRRELRPNAATVHYRTRSIPIPGARALTMEG